LPIAVSTCFSHLSVGSCSSNQFWSSKYHQNVFEDGSSRAPILFFNITLRVLRHVEVLHRLSDGCGGLLEQAAWCHRRRRLGRLGFSIGNRCSNTVQFSTHDAGHWRCWSFLQDRWSWLWLCYWLLCATFFELLWGHGMVSRQWWWRRPFLRPAYHIRLRRWCFPSCWCFGCSRLGCHRIGCLWCLGLGDGSRWCRANRWSRYPRLRRWHRRLRSNASGGPVGFWIVMRTLTSMIVVA